MKRNEGVTYGQLNENERDILRGVAHLQTFHARIKPTQVVDHIEDVRDREHCPSRTTIYRVLNRLCEMGVLQKVELEEDNRGVVYTITEQGCEVIRQLKQQYSTVANIDTILKSVEETKWGGEETRPTDDGSYQTDGSGYSIPSSRRTVKPQTLRAVVDYLSGCESCTDQILSVAHEVSVSEGVVESLCGLYPTILEKSTTCVSEAGVTSAVKTISLHDGDLAGDYSVLVGSEGGETELHDTRQR